MPSFSTSLSGLNADSTALTVIANNLANLNTVAFKGARPEFRDLFFQQIGSNGNGDPVQVGVGTAVGSISTLFNQGGIETSGVPTDVAIQGDGFFVVDKGGQRVFTRAGNFSVGATGLLVTDDGGHVLGNPAVNGVVTPGSTLSPLAIATGIISPPKATANVKLATNLDSGTAIGGTFSTSISVNDSLGASHVLTYTFTKTAANAWNYSITIPAADVGLVGPPVVVNSGALTFNGAGVLTAPATNVTPITIAGLADGANALTFSWNLYDANNVPVVTQVAGPSTTSSTTQDGFPSGTLVSVSVTGDGTVQGIFSNGQTLALGQIALANFTNTQGLIRNGNNEFLASLASGAGNIGAPGTGGRGVLSGGALELSNVDIATEFSKLILAERGFQANARAITTIDEVTQEAINLKR